MSSVPAGRRAPSPFEAWHNMRKIQEVLTDLVMRDFGYSDSKYEKMIDRYRRMHSAAPNLEEVVSRYENQSTDFYGWFIYDEGKIVLDMMREMRREFAIGNSIYPGETPAKIMEFFTRRYHINHAIGLCYALIQELNYIFVTLPVDMNQFKNISNQLELQASLLKGVRRADNKFFHIKKGEKYRTLNESVVQTFDGVSNVIRSIGHMAAIEKVEKADK